MTKTETPYHRVAVDSDVFAAIWRERRPGEDSENQILRRLHGLDDLAAKTAPPSLTSVTAALSQRLEAPPPRAGAVHREGDCDFAEGFEILRGFKGQEFCARATQGGWRFDASPILYPSLAALSRALGAGHENVWMAWRFRNRVGKLRPLDEYRTGKR